MDPWKTMSDMGLIEDEYRLYQQYLEFLESFSEQFENGSTRMSEDVRKRYLADCLTHPNHYVREFAQGIIDKCLED